MPNGNQDPDRNPMTDEQYLDSLIVSEGCDIDKTPGFREMVLNLMGTIGEKPGAGDLHSMHLAYKAGLEIGDENKRKLAAIDAATPWDARRIEGEIPPDPEHVSPAEYLTPYRRLLAARVTLLAVVQRLSAENAELRDEATNHGIANKLWQDTEKERDSARIEVERLNDENIALKARLVRETEMINAQRLAEGDIARAKIEQLRAEYMAERQRATELFCERNAKEQERGEYERRYGVLAKAHRDLAMGAEKQILSERANAQREVERLQVEVNGLKSDRRLASALLSQANQGLDELRAEVKQARSLIGAMIKGIVAWAQDEDGIPSPLADVVIGAKMFMQGTAAIDSKHPGLTETPEQMHEAELSAQTTKKCPSCASPDPARHPAMQSEGEVQPCPHPFHGAGRPAL